MTTSTDLSNRLHEVFINGTWIANTNYTQQLTDINIVQANCKLPQLNTIALITYHINYYVAGLIQILQGGKLTISDTYSWAMPPINTEAEWQLLLTTLTTNAAKFVNLVAQLPNNILLQPFTEPQYGTYLRNIEGVLEHSYYHLGQVVLIKKLVIENLKKV